MSDETKPKSTVRRVNLLDKAWREQKSAGVEIQRYITYTEVHGDGSEEEVQVEVPIRVLAGTENTQIKDWLLETDKEGNYVKGDDGNLKLIPDPDGSMGENALVAISCGITMGEANEYRHKGRSFWIALVALCTKYNGVTQAEVSAEKNGDTPDPSRG